MSETENFKLSEVFVCTVCYESFVDESALQLHSKSHDEVPLPHMGIFHKLFNAIRVMYENKVTHDSAEIHTENFESTRNEIESNLYAESFNHSSIPPNPEGLVVEHGIVASSSIEAGCSYLETRVFVCTVCHESFVDELALELHSKFHDHSSMQSGSEGLIVEHATATSSSIEAGFSYLETREYLGHEAVTQLGDEELHRCNVCGKTFKFNSLFDTHLTSHPNERPHICDICNKNFKKKWQLRQHKLTHSEERPYQCDICKKGFKTSNDLVKHKLVHSDERPYLCYICQKGFKSKKAFVRHKLVHSDERSFHCNICNQGFKTKSNLVNHKLLHRDERYFQGDICNRGFMRKEDFVGHKLTHTDEKPYQCDICNKKYTTKWNLKKHMLSHRDE